MATTAPTHQTLPATSSEPLHLEKTQFLGAVIALLLLLGGLGYWNALFNSLDVTPPQTKPQAQAALSKEEIIDKWVRERADGAFGMEITGRTANEILVKYRTRDSAGQFAENERAFRFDEQGNLAGVSLISTSRPQVVAETVAAQVVVPQAVAATAENFPWGVRAEKAGKAKVTKSKKTDAPTKRQLASMSHPAELSSRNARQEIYTLNQSGSRNSRASYGGSPVSGRSVATH